jgi:threonine synthase
MRFRSTRGEAPPLGFADAFAAGLAPDGGLYIPEELPDVSDLLTDEALPYPQLAAEFFKRFDDDHSPEEIDALCEKSYSSFPDPADAAPLVQLDDNLFVLELFHGPTLAFKDFGLQLVGNLFEDQIARTSRPINVLGATSGDTGSAAIHGLADREGANAFILYPKGRIAELQERQMACTGAKNIFPIAIEGSFDDAQWIVKDLFGDLDFKAKAGLSAINSINLARVLAQCVYYLHAVNCMPAALCENINFVVPTGNFGNVLAGWLAGRMGMPAEKFTVATNQNDLLHRLFNTGRYEASTVAPSLAPSMDIQVASNFERFVNYHLGGDGAKTSEIMAKVKAGEGVDLPDFDPDKFTATRTDDAGIVRNIALAKERYNYIADPHTACGFESIDPEQPTVLLATASPAKFPEVIEQAIGEHPTHPTLEALKEETPLGVTLPATANAVREYLEANILA